MHLDILKLTNVVDFNSQTYTSAVIEVDLNPTTQ